MLAALLAIPAAYLLAALAGSLIPVNRHWSEPRQGTTIYLVSNGIHTDIVMPVAAQGLDWRPLFPGRDFAAPPSGAGWIAVGAGEQRVYLETPTWADINARTVASAVAGDKTVIHVEYVPYVSHSARAIRLRPEEYRRLWAAVREGLLLDAAGRPLRIAHAGYGCCDAFYRGNGRSSLLHTCNTWVAARLRLAGVRTSVWSPFTQGLTWRYRRADQST